MQQASHRRFLTTFEHSPVGSLIVGPDGTLLAANLAVRDAHRATESPRSWRSTGSRSPNWASRCTCSSPSRRRSATVPNAASFEYRRPDGEVRYGLTQICAIEWPGSDQCSMVQVVDMTELAQSRIELQRSVNLFQATFDSSPIGLMIFGLDGVVRNANPAMGRLLSRPAAQIAGLSVDDFIHPEEQLRVKQFVARATSRSAVAVDHRIVRPDGEIRSWHAHVTRIDTDEGPALLGQAVDHTADRRTRRPQPVDRPADGSARPATAWSRCSRIMCSGTRCPRTIRSRCSSPTSSTSRASTSGSGPKVADQVLPPPSAPRSAPRSPPTPTSRRIGPDVFAVAAFGIDAATIANAAALIDRRLAEGDPNDLMGDSPISVRIGAVVVTRLDSSPSDLLQRAEGASRSDEANATGELAGSRRRAPVVLSSDGTEESKIWSEALEEALEARHFVALAQPLMSLGASKPLRRFELLVRLEMPGGQLLALPRFDQLAQRMGYGPRGRSLDDRPRARAPRRFDRHRARGQHRRRRASPIPVSSPSSPSASRRATGCRDDCSWP